MNVTIPTVTALLAFVACAAPVSAQAPGGGDLGAPVQRIAPAQGLRRGAGPPFARRGNSSEATESFSRTVRLGPGGTFELQNVAGNVTVSGRAGNEVQIQAVKRVRDVTDARAQAALADIQIEVAERAGNVEVRSVQRRVPVGLRAVDYTITVPQNSNVILRNGSGSVRVQNVSGEVRAESINGAVTAAGVRRIRALKTVSGNIDVTDGEADEFNVSTLSGNVIIRKLKGRLIDLHTITGNVQLQDVATDRAVLESMAGNLEYAGRLVRSGRYQFQTHKGNIRVIPSGNQGFDLDAVTFSGDLRSEFALKLPRDAAAAARQRPRRILRGTFGDAGAVLNASSFSGSITIIKP